MRQHDYAAIQVNPTRDLLRHQANFINFISTITENKIYLFTPARQNQDIFPRQFRKAVLNQTRKIFRLKLNSKFRRSIITMLTKVLDKVSGFVVTQFVSNFLNGLVTMHQ